MRGRCLEDLREGMICALTIMRMERSCRMGRVILFSIIIAFSYCRHVDNKLYIWSVQVASDGWCWRGNEVRLFRVGRDENIACFYRGRAIFARLTLGKITTRQPSSPPPPSIIPSSPFSPRCVCSICRRHQIQASHPSVTAIPAIPRPYTDGLRPRQ